MELLLERDRLLRDLPSQPSRDVGDVAANDASARILSKPVILLDGGLGTTLEDQYEVEYSQETPTWSSHLLIAEPETLLSAQTAFSRSGADIILTATYQASYEGFALSPGLSRTDAAEYMRSAIRIAKFAIGGRTGLIALSLGPYGATMVPSQEYTGSYGDEMASAEKLYDWHFDRIKPYGELWTEFDLVAFETIPRLSEIQAVRRVMQRIPSLKPYWISCVFPNDDKLPDSSTIKQAVDAMLEGRNPPFAIGINCTNIGKLPDLIKRFESASANLPRLVIYPDGAKGQVYDSTTQKWVGSVSEDAPAWEEQMVNIIKDVQARGRWQGIIAGGCCKTTPKSISKLKRRLEQP